MTSLWQWLTNLGEGAGDVLTSLGKNIGGEGGIGAEAVKDLKAASARSVPRDSGVPLMSAQAPGIEQALGAPSMKGTLGPVGASSSPVPGQPGMGAEAMDMPGARQIGPDLAMNAPALGAGAQTLERPPEGETPSDAASRYAKAFGASMMNALAKSGGQQERPLMPPPNLGGLPVMRPSQIAPRDPMGSMAQSKLQDNPWFQYLASFRGKRGV